MAEALFILADVEISGSALRRWLKSTPLSAAVFDDWPDSVFRADSGIAQVAAPAKASVADELLVFCMESVVLGDRYLHCNYDEQAKALHFAACFQYGDEAGIMERAIFLCALLRGITEVYTSKKPSFASLSDAGADLFRIEIGKKTSRIRLDPASVQLSPAWFSAWIGQDNLGDPDNLMAALFSPLARALKKQVTVGALRASPRAPYSYDGFFWTEGRHVYRWSGIELVLLQNADPKTFRRLTPGNSMSSAFYADARHLWYYQSSEVVISLVQSFEPGASLQGWRPFGLDGEPLARCGDTVWAVANIEYPNGGNVPDCAHHPKGRNTKDNVERVLSAIRSQGGIPTWEKVYNFEYVRPTQVEGASFVHVEGGSFQDSKSVYVQREQGLIRMEGALPEMTTNLGNLSCNNGRYFYDGCQIQQQIDATTLRYIGDDFYADISHVYRLYSDTGGHPYQPDLHILRDAQPESFRIIRALPNAILSGDARGVWLNGERIPGLIPDAIKFMGVFFWTDGNHVYHCEQRVPDADPKKFEVLAGSDYARQGATIYFRANPIPGADAASFVADDMSSAHDRHQSYQFDEAVQW